MTAATTLVLVNAPTLRDGLAEALRIADAVYAAGRIGAGVWVQRTEDGRLVEVEPDFDVAPGVIETSLPAQGNLDPWADPLVDLVHRVNAAQELEDILARVGPRDLVATPNGVVYL